MLIELPQKVVLEVTDTEPTVKGQTASSSYKPATLSNGVRTMVPPFVGTGTKIVVMTADGSYVERAKDGRRPLGGRSRRPHFERKACAYGRQCRIAMRFAC